MKLFTAIILVALSTCVAFAQEEDDAPIYDRYPHLNIITAFNLNGGGHSTVSENATVGVSIEKPSFLLSTNGTYDNAKKVNDNTIGNDKGHSRKFNFGGFYRLKNGWFFGGGGYWSQLSTTNYVKESWHPNFGGGRDFFVRGTSFRIKALYSLPGTDKLNGVQGPTINFILPSPITRHHFFFYESFSTSLFHTTVTDPTNKELTAQQLHDRSLASYLTLGVMFKF